MNHYTSTVILHILELRVTNCRIYHDRLMSRATGIIETILAQKYVVAGLVLR
jgi:hypothetical protein